MSLTPQTDQRSGDGSGWLTRNVVGMGVTSLLADTGYETVTAVLPGFVALLGVPAAALGAIEGVADSVSSFVKLAGGWLADRFGHRKAMAVGGYFLTGACNGLFGLASGWPLILAARALAWLGRGFRSPITKAILADSVPAEARGRAFGFERAGDTLGAILGPLLAVGLLTYLGSRVSNPFAPFRIVFLLALVPGLGSAACFAFLVCDKQGATAATRLWAALKSLPRSFRRYLWGVGVSGVGDFARTLMILATTQLLSHGRGVVRSAQIAALLYVGHNVAYAAWSYPVGALSDRLGRRGLLALGYLAGAITASGFAAAFWWRFESLGYLLALFLLAGISIAIVDSLEGAMTADLVEKDIRGTAYGVLGTVNGVGDLIASAVVGALWTGISPVAGFAYAAVLMGAGALVVYWLR